MALILLIGYRSYAYAQDPVFSLFQTNPLNYNPAHVGNTDFSRVSLGYRNQYPAYSNAFTSYAASFDTYFAAAKSGAGLMAIRDNMGSGQFTETTVSLGYSYNAQVASEAFIRGGLSASLRLHESNPNGLTFPDMININGGVLPNPSPYNKFNSTIFNMGAGLAFMYRELKVGVSVFNLGGRRLSDYGGVELPNPLRANAYLSYDIMLSGDEDSYSDDAIEVLISPNVQYTQQYGYQQLSIGAYLSAGRFFVGIYERQNLAFSSFTFSLAAGVSFGRVGLAFSGDMGTLGKPTGGISASAYELSLSVKLWDNMAGESRKKTIGGKAYYRLNGTLKDNATGGSRRRGSYPCPY